VPPPPGSKLELERKLGCWAFLFVGEPAVEREAGGAGASGTAGVAVEPPAALEEAAEATPPARPPRAIAVNEIGSI